MRAALHALVSAALLLAQIQPVLAQTRVMPSGTVTIPAGETTAPFDVIINGDTAVEPDEPYTVTVQSSIPITKPTASGTIVNDDGIVAPVLSVAAPSASIDKGSPVNFTVTRAGDASGADRVRWAVVPVAGATGTDEDNYPAVWSDEFAGSSVGSAWCVSGAETLGCPGVPSAPDYGTWDDALATVTGGALNLGIDETTGDWTSAQIVSKQAFQGGLLRYSITLPPGVGGKHSVWRTPETSKYGAGARNGKIIDLVWSGAASSAQNKEWRSALQYSGPTDATAPQISGRLVASSALSGAAHEGSTRWLDDPSSSQFTFSVDGTTYWQPASSDWPDTAAWSQDTVDEDGNPETIEWPAGGATSPLDQPFRIVLQSGVVSATSAGCSGETSCPSVASLDGSAVLVDWIRYFQYPTGEAVLQPGSDRVTVSIPTAANSKTGNKQFRLVLLSADSATISATNGSATATIIDDGTTPTDPGEETYALDFGLNAGGFTDQYGTTWQNGNAFVTGGTAIADTTTTGGSWTSTLDSPPTMRAGYITVEDKCPFDVDFPDVSTFNGHDVKFVWPTDRRCMFPKNGGSVSSMSFAGTNNPGARIWSVGGDFYTDAVHVNAGEKGALLAFKNFGPGGEIFIEGALVDSNGSCNDAFRPQVSGGSATGLSRITVQNSIFRNLDQCEKGHGDTTHMGTGVWSTLKMQNMLLQPRFQGNFTVHRTDGHGAYRLDYDHVFFEEYPNGESVRGGDGIWMYASTAGTATDLPPPDGIGLNEVYLYSPKNWTDAFKLGRAAPKAGSFDANKCAVYTAAQRTAANGLTGTWCWKRPPNGTFVPEDKVGRNYDRAFFTGTTPITIANARVPRLDTTRMTGTTMDIAIPVDTSRGNARLVTLGFSARDETAAAARVFDISGAVNYPSFDIFTSAGGRDTETTIKAPVTVGSDGILRLTLTGTTGSAQINWMTIERATVGVTLNKATPYNEGETMMMTFRREGPSATPASMGWRISGTGNSPASASDFVGATTGTAVFNAGAATVTTTRQITADTVAEPAESFAVVLTGGSGADIKPGEGSAVGSIAASTGTDPTDPECPDDTGATVRTVRVASETTVQLRKASLMQAPGLFRELNTCGTVSKVVNGPANGTDSKGTQPENPSPFVWVQTPAVPPRTSITDAFRFQLCNLDGAQCAPYRVELIITGR